MSRPEQSPHQRPSPTAREVVARLPEQEHLRLTNAVGGGLHDARLAAQCLTDPDHHTTSPTQFLAYLTRAIGQLELAREVMQRELEQDR